MSAYYDRYQVETVTEKLKNMATKMAEAYVKMENAYSAARDTLKSLKTPKKGSLEDPILVVTKRADRIKELEEEKDSFVKKIEEGLVKSERLYDEVMQEVIKIREME